MNKYVNKQKKGYNTLDYVRSLFDFINKGVYISITILSLKIE